MCSIENIELQHLELNLQCVHIQNCGCFVADISLNEIIESLLPFSQSF